jgi:large subunit ribosomal protein L3
VPGAKNTWLTVSDSVKVSRHADAPYPGAVKGAANSNEALEDIAPEEITGADTPIDVVESPEAGNENGEG